MPKLVGRDKKTYEKFGGFCLETQHYPDAINHTNFPSVVLKKDGIYNSKTVFKFGVLRQKRKAK